MNRADKQHGATPLLKMGYRQPGQQHGGDDVAVENISQFLLLQFRDCATIHIARIVDQRVQAVPVLHRGGQDTFTVPVAGDIPGHGAAGLPQSVLGLCHFFFPATADRDPGAAFDKMACGTKTNAAATPRDQDGSSFNAGHGL